ncbi:MAG: hypothetical protein HKN92_02490 [Chitinophagales bacterium]|nr:hypothetical protein [Chitinophagales bacterium]
MQEDNQINALISLLDDSDKEVYQHVFDKLVSFGPDIIPELETAWSETFNPTMNERIEELIHFIQFNVLKADFQEWKDQGGEDLLRGWLLISRFQFPDLNITEIEEKIDDLKKDIWLELTDNLTPIEKINIFNHVLYSLKSFKGNITDNQDPRYYCINHLLETHKGNPLSLGMLYIILAGAMEIPVYGVNLPRHFILCFNKYADPDFEDSDLLRKDVLFYINPLNKGFIFTRNEITEYLKKMQMKARDEYFVPCTNKEVMQILMHHMIKLFGDSGNPDKVTEIKQLLDILND